MNILIVVSVLLVLAAVFYFFFKGKTGGTDAESDAKRFARLLVSEIKLYNEQKVQRGLQNKNLSDALRDEIEQARKTYQKRFSNAEFGTYFDDVLVEILANGDQSKFASGFNSSLK